MIKIENTEVVGWEHAIRGMRNPKNSWNKTDSQYITDTDSNEYKLGENDLKLASILADAGTDHGKFLRMIVVYADITAPLYWLKEFDTYKVGTVANSCSTMHKIQAKEFTLDDFSHEHLFNSSHEDVACKQCLNDIIFSLNQARDKYLETKCKDYWWQMIQLLPTSYNQRRTVMLNYTVLKNMYHSRKNHKLDEWHTFCDWVETLPYAKELIIGE